MTIELFRKIVYERIGDYINHADSLHTGGPFRGQQVMCQLIQDVGMEVNTSV